MLCPLHCAVSVTRAAAPTRPLADATVQNRKTVEADFKLLLQDLNGAAVYSQLRKYLASNRTENYGF